MRSSRRLGGGEILVVTRSWGVECDQCLPAIQALRFFSYTASSLIAGKRAATVWRACLTHFVHRHTTRYRKQHQMLCGNLDAYLIAGLIVGVAGEDGLKQSARGQLQAIQG